MQVARTFPHKVFNVGKAAVLSGFLIVVGSFSAYLGMRFSIRGTEVEVPLVRGQTVEEAKTILSKVHLSFSATERYDPHVPKGVIATQHPRPGGRIKANREIQIVVSLGARRSPVPDLMGSSLRVARLKAFQAGYGLGHISEIPLVGSKNDEVIRQFPVPLAKEVASSKIDVLVSRTFFPRYTMPDVVGQRLNRVLQYFEKNGFKPERIQYRSHNRVARGTVTKQFPEPGFMLSGEGSINLEVAR